MNLDRSSPTSRLRLPVVQTIDKLEVSGYHDPDRVMTVADLEFIRCKFSASGFGYRHTSDFSRRSSARNIRIIDCQIRKCLIGPGMLEDIYIENLNSDVTIVWGALFNHVTIKGRCDKLMIHGITGQGDIDVGGRGVLPYRALCDDFYKSVDWALDISGAEFQDFSIRTRGVPTHLVRRDPETQAVVKRENAISGKWRDLKLSGLTQIIFKEFIQDGLPSVILVAPKRHKQHFSDVMADIRKLRETGIAELD